MADQQHRPLTPENLTPENLTPAQRRHYSQIATGQILRALRDNAGKTQETVASDMHTTLDALRRLEAGERRFTMSVIETYAAYYGSPVQEVLDSSRARAEAMIAELTPEPEQQPEERLNHWLRTVTLSWECDCGQAHSINCLVSWRDDPCGCGRVWRPSGHITMEYDRPAEADASAAQQAPADQMTLLGDGQDH